MTTIKRKSFFWCSQVICYASRLIIEKEDSRRGVDGAIFDLLCWKKWRYSPIQDCFYLILFYLFAFLHFYKFAFVSLLARILICAYIFICLVVSNSEAWIARLSYRIYHRMITYTDVHVDCQSRRKLQVLKYVWLLAGILHR